MVGRNERAAYVIISASRTLRPAAASSAEVVHDIVDKLVVPKIADEHEKEIRGVWPMPSRQTCEDRLKQSMIQIFALFTNLSGNDWYNNGC